MEHKSKYEDKERTEEVQDIIERMPTKFGIYVSLIVILIFLLLVTFGWITRYPDVINGQVVVNTSVAPIKMISRVSGRIRLIVDSSQVNVVAGTNVAYIESTTSYDSLIRIMQIIKEYNPNRINNTEILPRLPSQVSLGDLTSKYYNFLGSLHQMANFNRDRLYDNQIESLKLLRNQQILEVNNNRERIAINKANVEFSGKFLKRDSILYIKKVATEAELDKSKMSYLNSSAGYSNAKSGMIDAQEQALQTNSQIAEVTVQKNEKKKDIELALLAAYNDLIDNIRRWEQQYVFKIPFSGKLQFLRFWTDGQFVQEGEPVFTIVPAVEEPYGQVFLPAMGAGKVEKGQEVILKLNDFPYNEYGSISGIVSNISLTTNTERTSQGEMETYLVTVKFPNGLVTNYGKTVAFHHESKGIAEVITKDRRFIERLFDNLKYALNR